MHKLCTMAKKNKDAFRMLQDIQDLLPAAAYSQVSTGTMAGWQPLHLLCQNKQRNHELWLQEQEMLKALIAARADVNAKGLARCMFLGSFSVNGDTGTAALSQIVDGRCLSLPSARAACSQICPVRCISERRLIDHVHMIAQ